MILKPQYYEPNSAIQHLGEDVWVTHRIENPYTLSIRGNEYFRFMDMFYIPSKTTHLNTKQIMVINRRREELVANDRQFAYCRKIHRVFRNIIKDYDPTSLIEVGPGKFPLAVHENSKYVAVDIDYDAIKYLRSKRIDAHDYLDLPSFSGGNNVMCVGVFVMHFYFNDIMASKLDSFAGKNGVFLFNVITTDAQIRTSAANLLSRIGYHFKSIDLKLFFGKQDIIFLCAKRSALLNLERAYTIASRIVGEGDHAPVLGLTEPDGRSNI